MRMVDFGIHEQTTPQYVCVIRDRIKGNYLRLHDTHVAYQQGEHQDIEVGQGS